MESGGLNDFRFTGARRRLIETLRARGIEDLDLLRLFDEVPRHHFLPEGVLNRAYEDSPLPIGWGQTASQPSLQAHTLRLLAPTSSDRVLEIGTGSGFFTALLAQMADRVYSVERIRELSMRARRALDELDIQNAALMVGDGSIGWRKYAPFDVITVAAASPEVPSSLVDQLAPGGRMVVPVGSLESQELVRVQRSEDGEVVTTHVGDPCTFVPLVGRFGWPEERS